MPHRGQHSQGRSVADCLTVVMPLWDQQAHILGALVCRFGTSGLFFLQIGLRMNYVGYISPTDGAQNLNRSNLNLHMKIYRNIESGQKQIESGRKQIKTDRIGPIGGRICQIQI